MRKQINIRTQIWEYKLCYSSDYYMPEYLILKGHDLRITIHQWAESLGLRIRYSESILKIVLEHPNLNRKFTNGNAGQNNFVGTYKIVDYVGL